MHTIWIWIWLRFVCKSENEKVGLLFVVLQFFFLNIGRDGKQISMGFNADRKISFWNWTNFKCPWKLWPIERQSLFFRKIATMQHQVKIIDFINIIIKCAHKLLHKLNEYLQFLFLSNFVKSVLVHLVKLWKFIYFFIEIKAPNRLKKKCNSLVLYIFSPRNIKWKIAYINYVNQLR